LVNSITVEFRLHFGLGKTVYDLIQAAFFAGRSVSPSEVSPRASPVSRAGWKPRRSKSRSRWHASCAAN
jgi:hypothetical protein